MAKLCPPDRAAKQGEKLEERAAAEAWIRRRLGILGGWAWWSTRASSMIIIIIIGTTTEILPVQYITTPEEAKANIKRVSLAKTTQFPLTHILLQLSFLVTIPPDFPHFFPPNTGIGKNMLLLAMLVSCRILGGVKHILFSSIFLAPRDAKNPEGPCFFRPSDMATESPIASYERIGISSGVSSPGCQPQCLLVHQQEGNQAVEAIAYGLPNTALDRLEILTVSNSWRAVSPAVRSFTRSQVG